MRKLMMAGCVLGMVAVASAAEGNVRKMSPELEAAEADGCRLVLGFTMDESDMMRLRFAEAKEKADEGNALACVMVALGYASGEHWYLDSNAPHGAREEVRPDMKEAFRYAGLSAEKGNAYGKGMLGQMHFFGLGTPTNYVEAIKVFEGLTNNLGYATGTAGYFLGRCYWEGRGVKVDLEKAEELLGSEMNDGTFAGLASEWLWAHGKPTGKWRRMLREGSEDPAAHYRPVVCNESEADVKAKEPAVRFMPGAKTVVMVRPDDAGLGGWVREIARYMDDDRKAGDGAGATVSWAALSVLDVDVAYDYGSVDGGEFCGPRPDVKKLDVALAVAFDKPIKPNFGGMDSTPFKDGDLEGFDGWARATFPLPPGTKGCATMTKNGLLVCATNHETLRQARDFYQGSGEGSFTELALSGATAGCLSAPNLGELLVHSFPGGTLEKSTEQFFSRGFETLSKLGAFNVRLFATKGDKVRFVATLTAGSENDAKRISCPLKVLIPRYAGMSTAVMAECDKNKRPLDVRDEVLAKAISNLRLVTEGKTVKVETFVGLDDWKRFVCALPADGGPCPESDATTVAREQIGVPVVVRLLRGLRAAQEADGSWSDSGSNRLANTSLAVLALASHGDYLGGRSPSTKELVSAFDAGVGCLAKSVYEREGVVRFRGGEEDPRSELLASFAVFYVYSLTGRRDLRDPAEKLAGRLAKEDFPFLEAELDADNAERIQWLVLALEHARFCKFGSPELDSRIARARARIDGYHPGEGYYGLWRDHDSGFNVGDKEAFERFVRNYRELKSTVVKDETCRLQRTGLGPVADTAVTILQLDWAVSHKAPRSCKGDAAAGVPVEI